jgi:hypothetical protein
LLVLFFVFIYIINQNTFKLKLNASNNISKKKNQIFLFFFKKQPPFSKPLTLQKRGGRTAIGATTHLPIQGDTGAIGDYY